MEVIDQKIKLNMIVGSFCFFIHMESYMNICQARNVLRQNNDCCRHSLACDLRFFLQQQQTTNAMTAQRLAATMMITLTGIDGSVDREIFFNYHINNLRKVMTYYVSITLPISKN